MTDEGVVSQLVRISPAEFSALSHELGTRLRASKDWVSFWDEHVYKPKSERLLPARVMIATMLMIQLGCIMAPEKKEDGI